MGEADPSWVGRSMGMRETDSVGQAGGFPFSCAPIARFGWSWGASFEKGSTGGEARAPHERETGRPTIVAPPPLRLLRNPKESSGTVSITLRSSTLCYYCRARDTFCSGRRPGSDDACLGPKKRSPETPGFCLTTVGPIQCTTTTFPTREWSRRFVK